MTLLDLYFQAGGSAFYPEITEDIALDYLSEHIKDLNTQAQDCTDLEDSNYALEKQVSSLEDDLTDMEAEKDKFEDKLTEVNEGLTLLRGRGKLTGRGSRLVNLLEALKQSEYESKHLLKGDIDGIISSLEVLT